MLVRMGAARRRIRIHCWAMCLSSAGCTPESDSHPEPTNRKSCNGKQLQRTLQS